MSDAIRKMYNELQARRQAAAGPDERAYRMLTAAGDAGVDGPSIVAAAGPKGPDEERGFWPPDSAMTPTQRKGYMARVQADAAPRDTFSPAALRTMTDEDKLADLDKWSVNYHDRSGPTVPGPVGPNGEQPKLAQNAAEPPAQDKPQPAPKQARAAGGSKKLRDYADVVRKESEQHMGDWEKGLTARLAKSRQESAAGKTAAMEAGLSAAREDADAETARLRGRAPSEPLTEKDRAAVAASSSPASEREDFQGSPSRIRDYRRLIAENGLDSEGNPLPGVLTPMQQRQLDNGGALPEGLPANRYPVEQTVAMGRDVNNPAARMLPSGGTFTHHPDGALSTRAITEPISDAELKHSDPRELAPLVGIDASQYGMHDDALLRAHVIQAAERHNHMRNVARVKETAFGVPYYAADPIKAERALEDRESAYPVQRRMQLAGDMIARHSLTGADADRVIALARSDEPNAFRELREQDKSFRLAKQATNAQKASDRAANFNIARDLNNPAVAPGMYIRTLQAAVNSGDPLAMAAAYSSFGQHDLARNAMELSGQRAQLEAQERSEQRMLDASKPKPTAAYDDLKLALGGILQPGQIPGADAQMAITAVLQQLPGADNPEVLKEYQRFARDYVTNHIATIDPNHPDVVAKLQTLRKLGRPAFKQYVTTVLRRPDLEEQLWNDTASGWGAIGAAISNGYSDPVIPGG
jgi:hypothetical protein